MNILYCVLDANEYNRICSCETAKQIWDKLVVTYEGRSQVKEAKINMLVHQYELFKTQPDESIKEMFTRVTDITNSLKSLGKSYANEEMVGKILRCLPKNKWGPEVTAIEKAQNLKTLAMDDLLRKLMTHEIHLKEDEEVVQIKKAVAFKAVNKDLMSSEDESSEENEDSTEMIAKGLMKMLKSKRFDPKSFIKRDPHQGIMRNSQKVQKFLRINLNLIWVLVLVVVY